MITRIRQSLVAAALAGAVLAASPAWALPTEAAVQAQVQKGRYDEAESMMAEVLAAKPDSPKAHYLYAQILAKRGRLDLARQHAAKARALDPSIGFTTKARFESFEKRIATNAPGTVATPAPQLMSEREMMAPQQRHAAQVQAAEEVVSEERVSHLKSTASLWPWVLGIGLGWWLLRRMARRGARRPVAGTGWGGGMRPGPGPSQGPGWGGVGMAGLGGFAAGMAAEHWLRRDSDAGSSSGPSWDAQAAGPELDLSGGSSDNWDTGGGVDMGGGGGDW